MGDLHSRDHTSPLPCINHHSNHNVNSPLPVSAISHNDSLSSVQEEMSERRSADSTFDQNAALSWEGPRSHHLSRLCLRQGQLLEKFCNPCVEASFQKYWCCRAVRQVRQSKLVIVSGFSLFLLEEVVSRLTVADQNSLFVQLRLILRCIVWAFIFAVRFFPLPNNEKTYPVVRGLAVACGVLAVLGSWDQKESASMIRMVFLTCIGCILLNVRSHLNFVAMYSLVRLVNFAYDTYELVQSSRSTFDPVNAAALAAAASASALGVENIAEVIIQDASTCKESLVGPDDAMVAWMAVLEMKITSGIAHCVAAAGSVSFRFPPHVLVV